jgi:hypothetical protein
MANGNGSINGGPSQDQLIAQLRILIPALGTIATTAGWLTSDQTGPLVANCLIALGPVMYIGGSVWSYYANSRASILASAAKSVAPGVPPPQIVLPVQEKALADALPANVSTTETKKVVSCSGNSA